MQILALNVQSAIFSAESILLSRLIPLSHIFVHTFSGSRILNIGPFSFGFLISNQPSLSARFSGRTSPSSSLPYGNVTSDRDEIKVPPIRENEIFYTRAEPFITHIYRRLLAGAWHTMYFLKYATCIVRFPENFDLKRINFQQLCWGFLLRLHLCHYRVIVLGL